MTPRQAMQENAWNDIQAVERAEDWCRCDECCARVQRIPGVRLPPGVERWACSMCLQRYDVTRPAPYEGFGSF